MAEYLNVGQGPDSFGRHGPMRAPDTGVGGTKDNEPNHDIEDAAASRMYLRSGESLNSELIAAAEDPAELFMGLRRLEGMLEDTIIPQGLAERYSPPRDATIMYEKSKNFAMTAEELQELHIIVPGSYNKKGRGEAKLKSDKFLSVALRVDQKPIYLTKDDGTVVKDQDGDPIERGTKSEIIIGTNEKRAEMSKANELGAKELGARDVLGEHYGMRINEEIRDSYETMSAYMHSGRTPKLTTDMLKTITNMPSQAELRNGKEIEKAHELGDMFEEGLACNLLMTASNSKERMINLLARPGMVHLITKMAKEEEEDRRKKAPGADKNLTYTYDNWVADNIGDYMNWVDDDKRKLKETWREERVKGLRKGLAQWSNILAWEGNPGEFGEDKEDSFIQETVANLIGGGKEGVEAAWLALVFMRVTGVFSTEGYAALPDGSTHLPLGEDRSYSADDFAKAYALMFNKKEGEAGRPSGLKDMIGKIPDLAMSLLDWAQVEMRDLPKNPDGSYQRRSILDAWLGTAEQPKRSLLRNGEWAEITDPVRIAKGEGVKMKVRTLVTEADGTRVWKLVEKVFEGMVKKEEYHRLGDLDFKSLPRRFHGTFTIMQWLMGNERGPTGVNIEAQNMDFEYRDFRLNALKKLKKYVGIVMNQIVLTKGSPHLYTDADGDAKIIQKNYLRNLLIARIHSETFATTILGMTIKLFNPDGGGFAEVPAPVLIRLFIKEVLKPNPKGEMQIRKRYVDENSKLRSSGTGGTPGIREDVIAILDEEFLPEKKKIDPSTGEETEKTDEEYALELEQMKYVGRVTGRKII